MDEPAPYPAERARERLRWLPFPVERPPGRRPAGMTATRTDGTTCDIGRTLGWPSVPAPDGDDGVRWYPWPA